jgi:hypothetical protein
MNVNGGHFPEPKLPTTDVSGRKIKGEERGRAKPG